MRFRQKKVPLNGPIQLDRPDSIRQRCNNKVLPHRFGGEEPTITSKPFIASARWDYRTFSGEDTRTITGYEQLPVALGAASS